MSGALHLIVVRAEDADEAQAYASSYFDEGSVSGEVRGSISEDNEIHGSLSKEYNSIEKINAEVQSWIDSPPYKEEALKHMRQHIKEALPNSVKLILDMAKEGKKQKKAKPLTDDDWYVVQKYVEHMKHVAKVSGKFDVLHDEFFSMDFTEFGVTHHEGSSDGKWYVVEVVTKY